MNIVLSDSQIASLEILKDMINPKELGLDCTGYAVGGEELLSLIEKQNPDIVVADIHTLMTEGDSFIEKCSERVKNLPAFIAICSDSETKLIRKAMKNSINAFVPKPVDKTELNNIIKEVAEKIRSERLNRKNRAIMVNNILNRIINGDNSEDTFHNFATLIGIKPDAPITYLFLDIAKYNDFDIWNENINMLNKRNSIIELLGSIADDSLKTNAFYVEAGIFAMVVQSQSRQKVWELCDRIVDKLDNEYALKTAAVIVPNIQISQIFGAHNDCIECSRSLSEYNTVMWCDRQVLQKSYRLDNFSVEPIIEAISSGDLDRIDEIINSDFKRFEVHGNPLVLMRGFAASAFFEIMQITDLTSEECSEPLSHLFKRIQTARNLYELREVCKEMCYFTVGVLLELESTRKALTENDVISYIKNHYAEGISLEEISEKFHMKQTVLSKIIKDKTGYKFKDFLNLIRVQNAQKMILSSDKKIMQIALEVGYKDYCYFVRKFKSVYGELPSEYKKQHTAFKPISE